MARQEIVDNLDELLAILPAPLQQVLQAQADVQDLIEIVLDLGRLPEARFSKRTMYLSEEVVTREELKHIVKRVGQFGQDNRAGIERTLHRISAIRNRRGEIIGLTCRVGRAVFGTIDIVEDVITTGASLLLLGPPGVGKTTVLREVARVLADEFGKRVVVVDTSNEIAGDGDIPHPGIGHARRMQVPQVDKQAQVMIEAVENHMPEVIIIDEIGIEAEALAARTIAERGVQLVGTAHGVTLENLIANPTLSDLIGGIQAVTLGDDEARKRRTQKTVLERKAPPTFDIVVEIQDKNRFAIHHDVAKTVDAYLRGIPLTPEVRQRNPETGAIERIIPSAPQRASGDEPLLESTSWEADSAPKQLFLFPYALSRNRIEQAIRATNLPVAITEDLLLADLVLTLKGQYRKMPKRLREAEREGLPIYTIRSNTQKQIENFLGQYLAGNYDAALEEVRQKAPKVKNEGEPQALTPQNAYVRLRQHQLVREYGLRSASSGTGANRHVVIYPQGVPHAE